MSEHILKPKTPGPVTLDLKLTHGDVTVEVGDFDNAEVIAIGDIGPGEPSTHQDGDTWRVSIPVRGGGGGGIMVRGDNFGSITFTGSNHQVITGDGDFVIAGRDIRISGSEVSIESGQGGINISTAGSGGGAHVHVRLPKGSSLLFGGVAADLLVIGPLRRLKAETTSGAIQAAYADKIDVLTVSGAIHLERTDLATVESTSGKITIGDFGGTARLSTISGKIRVNATEPGDIHASTISGRIEVTAPQSIVDAAGPDRLVVTAKSVSGKIVVPQPTRATSAPRRRRNPGWE